MSSSCIILFFKNLIGLAFKLSFNFDAKSFPNPSEVGPSFDLLFPKSISMLSTDYNFLFKKIYLPFVALLPDNSDRVPIALFIFISGDILPFSLYSIFDDKSRIYLFLS